jgi:predicted DNA-binding ribbon-helix-helix protein
MAPNVRKPQPKVKNDIERVQTGIRLEKRLLKVLKALAEYMDVSVGELIEVIVLSSFEGTAKFSKGTLNKIADLKRIYDLDYGIEAASMMVFTANRGGR